MFERDKIQRFQRMGLRLARSEGEQIEDDASENLHGIRVDNWKYKLVTFERQ